MLDRDGLSYCTESSLKVRYQHAMQGIGGTDVRYETEFDNLSVRIGWDLPSDSTSTCAPRWTPCLYRWRGPSLDRTVPNESESPIKSFVNSLGSGWSNRQYGNASHIRLQEPHRAVQPPSTLRL